MARARNIKPGLFKNEILGVADPLYTLLFQGLWVLADREGRLEDRPLRIKAEVFPYRDGIDMGSMLGWLESNGFIHRYQYGGLALIQILNFTKHHNPHKNEPESIYAPPEGIGTTPEFIGSTPADSLSTDSGFLIPDSGLSKPGCPPSPRRAKAKTGMPEGFAVSDRVRSWAKDRGFGKLDEHLDAFKRKAQAKGYAYVDWDAALMEAIREDWAKLRGRTQDGAAPPPDGREGEWHETRSGVEKRAAELGLGSWSQTEQFDVYRRRVMAADAASDVSEAA